MSTERLDRTAPYRGCPRCLRPVDWVYTDHDDEPGVLGLGMPLCARHGRQKGWVVVEGEALQADFLTGGYVTRDSGWVEVADGALEG
jgi:hypothetical protein